jgi:MFS family permease
MLKAIFITIACIVVGATIGGFFGYWLNVWHGGVKDPESLWFWAFIVGAAVGAIAAGPVIVYLRSRSKSVNR